MDISLIGENAGKVWNVLNENGAIELSKIKKETKLKEDEIAAAIGWLAREEKIQVTEEKKARKTIALYSLR